MDSSCNKSHTENTKQVFELIITNPCSKPSEPVEISCVIKDLTGKTSSLDSVVSKDGFTDPEPIFMDDLDAGKVTSSDAKVPMDNATKNIEANTETSTKVTVNDSSKNITVECNDNQKQSTKRIIILDDKNTEKEKQKELVSSQIIVKNLGENELNESDLDLYETELQNAFEANKTNSKVCKSHQNPVVIDTEMCKKSEKVVSSDNIAIKDVPTTDSDLYLLESQNVKLKENRKDSDVIVLDSTTKSENTVTKDNNKNNNLGKVYPPIDLIAEEENLSSTRISEDYADEFKENSLMRELVQKCINMENTGGMKRVINRTLLNIYRSVEEKYKTSNALRRVLTRTIMKLHMEPEFKFSHIKCLCDHLKGHMVKKRVPLITLEKRSSGDQSTSSIQSKKRRLETIDLDSYSENNESNKQPEKPKEYPPIEIDSTSSIEEINDVMIVDNDKAKKKRKKKKRKKKQKGSLAGSFIPTLVRNPFCTNPDPSLKEIPTSNETERVSYTPIEPFSNVNTANTSTNIAGSIEEPQFNYPPLLTPVMMEPVPLHYHNSDQLDDEAKKAKEIEEIEKYLAFLRECIEKLDEMEVQEDSVRSPYIVSEQYQSMLVKQYKRLCELTGTQEQKQHKVRLQVLPGHPEAPVRYLQEFLNSNIDEEGNPPFPDLYDVIECVSKANVECHMNWGQAQIVKEARALFIQLGQRMQKRRQKREYKDLMSRVKEEVDDPAEHDPELMMKLNHNSWIAKQKENELLDRYANLEEIRAMASSFSVLSENGVPDSDTESSDDENANPRVPCASTHTYEREKQVRSSVPIMNGNIVTNPTYTQTVVGSTISLSNGHIEIAPSYDIQNSNITIPNGITSTPFQNNSNNQNNTRLLNSGNTFGVNSIQNADLNTFVLNSIQNVTTQEKIAQCNNNLNYIMEFKNYTLKLADALSSDKFNLGIPDQSNARFNNTNLSTGNNSTVGTVTIVNNRTVGTVSTVNNCNVGTVFNNLSTVNNTSVDTVSIGNNNISIVDSNKVISSDDLQNATDLAKTIMKLVQTETSPGTTKNNKNKDTDENVCDVFTHKIKPINTVNKTTEVKDTPKCIETKTDDTNVPNQAKVETASELETKDVPIEDIVKPEPLDIPKMLANLGEEYTAVVFDIEDPFLVIEISDSSESEDEVT